MRKLLMHGGYDMLAPWVLWVLCDASMRIKVMSRILIHEYVPMNNTNSHHFHNMMMVTRVLGMSLSYSLVI